VLSNNSSQYTVRWKYDFNTPNINRHYCHWSIESNQSVGNRKSTYYPFDAQCFHMGGTAIKHPMPDRVKPSFVIFDIRALWSSECQSARISKITNDGLTRSGIGCFIAGYPYTATVGVKGLSKYYRIWYCNLQHQRWTKDNFSKLLTNCMQCFVSSIHHTTTTELIQ